MTEPKSRIVPGQRFGLLVILERSKPDKFGNYRFLCQCDCGKKKSVSGSNLSRGHTQSCGCQQGKQKPSPGGFETKNWQSWLCGKTEVTA